ncbi:MULTISPECIES: hypothetical protein [Phyllobacteriaceae]|jgi:hypothetical protein|uniref:Uncharacterized protein n=1 Tax=Mesorhizobium hungaricum TaxID=1566387 RepID=A0A1C2DIY8_9HYPH|nr:MULTISPECIES: hypothetical protein [Mesorhizobium]MBN9233112.1 hypothetical protein [Mesorhizobium sp.]MDQ0332202.1 hypothetical protein [Mesorhizobium sp. YL-MeA3-2017]OCX14732.1 hypothetical protein QV13_20100 [Mesorhizobium hungaricum]
MRSRGPAGLTLSRLSPAPGRLWPAAILGFLLTISTGAAQDKQKVWDSGPYSFSDELGGFRITGVSGKGTRQDPIVIQEELRSATPITLTIRAIRPVIPFDPSGDYVSGILYMRVVTMNNSGHPWQEFQFELQKILGEPSTFSDGLSFDQRDPEPEHVSSSNFAKFERLLEPYDRLLFSQGKIDPKKSGEFEFLITDYTPRWAFYIVQDPRIPST